LAKDMVRLPSKRKLFRLLDLRYTRKAPAYFRSEQTTILRVLKIIIGNKPIKAIGIYCKADLRSKLDVKT